MNTVGVLTAGALGGAFVAAVVLVWQAVARRDLGIAHPALVWLILSGLFFGAGSAVLAVQGETIDPALYLAGSVVGFGLGVWASDRLGARRGDAAPVYRLDGTSAIRSGTRRWAPPLLAAIAVGAILQTLVEHGIPFLTTDITGARSELTGIPIQLVRVALPGLAGILMFELILTADRRVRWLAGLVIVAIAGFTVLLASRYLIIELGAVLVLAWLLAGRRIPVRLALVVAGLALVAFAGIQVLRAYDQAAGNELGFATERTINRVVLVQPRTLAALQRVIPAEEPYFLGMTWLRRLGPLIGRQDIPNLGYWIYPEVVEGAQDTAGYAAPGLIGEAWANFGPAGLVLFVFLGILAERLGALVSARRSNAVDMVAGALLILFLARTHALGVGGLAVLAVLVIAWRVLAGPSNGVLSSAGRVAIWRAPRASSGPR
ncbi:MAG: hypothetical protein ACXWWR_07845 [Candidatus Limnocylindrales bacterium]